MPSDSDAIGQEKTCSVCGRTFGWRKRWAKTWSQIKVCSSACGRRRLTRIDRALEEAIVSMLHESARGGSISPVDAAKAVAEDWKPLNERAREAARRLCGRGLIEFWQSGRIVEASSAKGPVQLRLTNRGRASGASGDRGSAGDRGSSPDRDRNNDDQGGDST